MLPNVHISVRRDGKLREVREACNTWTIPGNDYLARMVGYLSQAPDTPFENARVKHLRFGIGGVLQSYPIPVAVDTAYPAGFDPNATTGNEYSKDFVIEPPISTLERPIRFTGGTTPYASPVGTDVWISDATPIKFLMAYVPTGRLRLRYAIDSATELVYAPFTEMPISELGLSLNNTADEAYGEVLTYVNFDTIVLVPGSDVEIIWEINF